MDPYQRNRPARAGGTPGAAAPERPEETLVADARAGLSPADMVERKLLAMTRGTPLATSPMGTRRPRYRHPVRECLSV